MNFSIVIPTYGNPALLAKCLASTTRLKKSYEYEIIVVDDGSGKDSQKALRKILDRYRGTNVKSIFKPTNTGFASSVNLGIDASQYEVVVLCNSDIVFVKDIFGPLERAFRVDPKIGVVGGLLTYPQGTIQHAGLVFDPVSKSFIHAHKHKPKSVAKSGYALAVTGALFAIHKTLIGYVGLLDEQYFLACEDTEYCLQTWQKGFRVYLSTDVTAVHLEGATRGNDLRTKRRKNHEWAKKEADGITSFKKSLNTEAILKLSKEIFNLSNPPKKVEIGSGYSPHPGYLHLDIRPGLPQLDYVCDFSKEKLPFEDGEVSELLANHLIEHLSFRKLPFVLKEWYRVLAPGGKLILRTPNLKFICESYLAGKITPEWPGDEKYIKDNLSDEVTPAWWANIKLFSGQDYDANFHHVCFDFDMLKSLLEKFGFISVNEQKFDKTFSPGELQVTARKSKGALLLVRKGAIGDVLLLTPIVHRLHDDGYNVYVETDCPDVFFESPHVVGAGKHIPRSGKKVIDLNLAYERTPKVHIIDAYSKAVFGDTNTPHKLEMYGVKSELPYKGDYIVIHPGVSWQNRTWPRESWQKLVDLLGMHYNIIVVGTRSDLPLSGVVDSRGRYGIHEAAAVIQRAQFFIGIDSAILHIAQAVGTKSYGIFTCAKPEFRTTGALSIIPDIDCHGCLHEETPPVTFCGCRRGDFKCLELITPEQVLEAILKK